MTLIGEDDKMHDSMTSEVIVTCRNNPINVKIKQDLTSTFLYTKGNHEIFQQNLLCILSDVTFSISYVTVENKYIKLTITWYYNVVSKALRSVYYIIFQLLEFLVFSFSFRLMPRFNQ